MLLPVSRLSRGAAALAGTLLLYGCATQRIFVEEPEEPPRDLRLGAAAALVETRSWYQAEWMLRGLAAECENGDDGRQALLLLTSLLLDPRNPGAVPDSAAVMAARFLRLPNALPLERVVAEGLYLLALDFGADPGLARAARTEQGRFARRFGDCAGPARPPQALSLPTLGREPLALQLRRLNAERDSLAKVVDQRSELEALRARNNALERQVGELGAELDRIRRLLGGSDTTATRMRRR